MEPTALAARVKAIAKERAAIVKRVDVIERRTRALERELEHLAKEQEAAGSRLQEIDALVSSIEELAGRVVVKPCATKQTAPLLGGGEGRRAPRVLAAGSLALEKVGMWAAEHPGEEITREQLAAATGVPIGPTTISRAMQDGMLVRISPSRYRSGAAVKVA